jgi:hypothetical protein
MWKHAASWLMANRKLITITFEVFWILVFLLDRMISANPSAIPQFIYVNF